MKKILFVGIISIVVLIILALILSFLIGGVPLLVFAKQVAVIPVKGEIIGGESAFIDNLTAEEIVEAIDEANSDPAIGAILFDIDSPGGSLVATKQIVYKIREIDKPTVSYIGEIGASGAYYVASATDYIISDPDSITGSIGVISIVPNIEGLLEKIGIKVKVLKEGKLKTMASPFHEMSAEEEELLQEILQEAFEGFKSDILLFREEKIDEEAFSRVADGRILSGRQALEANLIDDTGTKDKAIKKAAEAAGIEGKPLLKYYSKRRFGLLDLFMGAGYSFASGFKRSLFFPEGEIRA